MGNTYLAADFGGGSGRVMAGTLENGKVHLEEVHRFTNRQIRLGKHVYWDFPALFEDMKEGLRKAAANKAYAIKSIGVDTWGVDFGLIDKEGTLLGNPVCYRDSRTEGIPEKLFMHIDRSKHYTSTGIQVMSINTLFQLYSMKLADDVRLQAAHRLLFMPDLFSFYLSGVFNNEYCIASTSELLDARRRDWDKELIRQTGLPEHLFGNIVMPGTIRGKLLPGVACETGLSDNIDIIAVGSHDTASAVAAVPSAEPAKAFLSSGTWSLFGVETDEPILTEEARIAGFTNEGGVGGKIRFLQNITGLWILQRLMAEWKACGEEVTFDLILPQAARARIGSVIDVDSPDFLNPANMEEAIFLYCRSHNLDMPQSKADYVRCTLQSLAVRYKKAVEQMNSCLPTPIKQLHIIGGGSRNALLNQLTADALGIPVYAGPVEATAIGNILMQALAEGDIRDMDELKQIAIRSAEPTVYYPKH